MAALLWRKTCGRIKTALVLAVALVLKDSPSIDAMIHSLNINGDARRAFQIETFGFREGGFMNLTVSGFSVKGSEPYRAGLLVRKTETEIAAQEHLEEALEGLERGKRCLLDEVKPEDLVLELTPESGADAHAAVEGERGRGITRYANQRVGHGHEGLYVLIYCACRDTAAEGMGGKEAKVAGPDMAIARSGAVTSAKSAGRVHVSRHLSSFKLKVAFWNEGVGGAPDYLPAGSEPLPKLFLGMFCLFLGALMVWVHFMRKYHVQVHNIHYLMAVLLVFKTLSMFFESIRYHYLRLTGAAEAWSIIYYLFAFLKGITLFVVILLIGMGWSLIKPFLNGRDKRIIFIVLSLQVVNNLVQIVLEETGPGSAEWLEWRRVLHLVDVLCCCFVLVPIVWSIRHLKQASLADGKAGHTIHRLRVFTQFYQMVLLYLYFTRIVVVLISAMLPFELSWVQTLASEMATLVFFVFTGWRFRPQPDAAYLPLNKLGDEGDATMGDDKTMGLELQDSKDFARHAV